MGAGEWMVERSPASLQHCPPSLAPPASVPLVTRRPRLLQTLKPTASDLEATPLGPPSSRQVRQLAAPCFELR